MKRNPYAVQGMDGWVEGVLEDRRGRTTRPTTPAGAPTPRSHRGADAGGPPHDAGRLTPVVRRTTPMATPMTTPRAGLVNELEQQVHLVHELQDSAQQNVRKQLVDVREIKSALLEVFADIDDDNGEINQALKEVELYIESLLTRIEELEKTLLELQTKSDNLLEFADDFQQQCMDLTAENQIFTDENNILRQKNLDLEMKLLALETEKKIWIQYYAKGPNRQLNPEVDQQVHEYLNKIDALLKQLPRDEAQKQAKAQLQVRAGAGGGGKGKGVGGKGKGVVNV